MTFPIMLGWPQFFLLLIALLGIVLLTTAFRRRRRIETFTDERGVIRERRRRRGIGWGRAVSGVVLVVDASYGNAVFQTAGSFDIFATQDALIARPT